MAALVTVDAVGYGRTDTIALTVANKGQRALFTEDQKTGCSIVTLQRQDGSSWTGISTCGMERAPQTVVLAPGEQRGVALRLADETLVEPGTYRVTLGFRLDRDPQGVEPEQVHSPTFTVG